MSYSWARDIVRNSLHYYNIGKTLEKKLQYYEYKVSMLNGGPALDWPLIQCAEDSNDRISTYIKMLHRSKYRHNTFLVSPKVRPQSSSVPETVTLQNCYEYHTRKTVFAKSKVWTWHWSQHNFELNNVMFAHRLSLAVDCAGKLALCSVDAHTHNSCFY